MNFTIPGNPIAKQRARVTRRGTYDPQQDIKIKLKLVMTSKRNGFGVEKPLEDPVEVKMRFHTQIPASLSRTKQMALENVFNPRRPDIDNYVKMYFDVMNGIIFTDDGQVVNLTAEKRYSFNPRVEITVNVLGEKY